VTEGYVNGSGWRDWAENGDGASAVENKKRGRASMPALAGAETSAARRANPNQGVRRDRPMGDCGDCHGGFVVGQSWGIIQKGMMDDEVFYSGRVVRYHIFREHTIIIRGSMSV